MKATDIVKPSDLLAFLDLQIACLSDEVQKLCFLARFDHVQHHLPGAPVIELMAFYEIAQTPALEISFLVTDRMDEVLRGFESMLTGSQIAQTLGVAWVALHQGLRLEPVRIAKPWGQEIWYTGIEQRGVSCVMSEEGKTPLDRVLAAAPSKILGAADKLTLLKILDPLPDEVYGDLYFEMHEEKQEVYVVTHVDTGAWPNGRGGIRFGFNQVLRKTFASDAEFRKAYLQSVLEYRAIREQIDVLLDQRRTAEQIGLHAPVMPDVLRRWQAQLSQDLLAEEKRLRDKMENFIAIKPLSIGDVVKVPCFTPHSLQHGVRTVEFQTPVYERKILSFAQKVLTQAHWDTEAALEALELDAPAETALAVLEQTPRLLREEVVRFSDFMVERITLEQGAHINLPSGHYRLLMVIAGELVIAGATVCREEACLLPAAQGIRIESSHSKTVILVAQPA